MYLRRMTCAVVCMALSGPAVLFAQAPAAQPAPAPSGPIAPADSLNGLMNALGYEVTGAAEAMPADKYDFAPPATMGDFKGVRTFGQQVKHLAEANYQFFHGWTVPGATAVDPKTIEALTTKDDIVKALKDSYVYAHAAISTITPENSWDAAPSFLPPQFKITRASIAAFCIAHSMDHYGQMVEYLRMNGIIPPASRPNAGSM
ncbi:MAG: DinB family protein [Acidobacteriaceae bacterium]